MGRCKPYEGATELGELFVELIDLVLGECGREFGKGPLGLLLSLEGCNTNTSQPVHGGNKVR